MKWLTDLENCNLAFRINFLKKNDSILAYQEVENHKIIYILDGFMQAIKVFTNGETACQKLLYNNDIFTDAKPAMRMQNSKVNYYYQIKALTHTTIIVVSNKECIKKICNINRTCYEYIYTNNEKHQEIIKILSHKNAKKRLVQLLLVLIEKFGIFTSYNFVIPFNISHSNIATIIGSQRITVNNIMNKFKKKQLIYYDDRKIIIFNIIKLTQS